MRNILVKLRDQDTSLTCPFTGWSITRSEEKKTPKVFSKQISDWIKNKALIALESVGETGSSVNDLVAEPHKSMTKPQLVEMAKLINAAEGDEVIVFEDVNKGDISESIQDWKDEKEIGDGNEGEKTGENPDGKS